MTAYRFHLKEKIAESTSLVLEGREHHHLSNVARIRQGDQVWLFDDEGIQYKALVEKIDNKKTLLQILETYKKREPKLRITLAQVLLKPKTMRLVIQKATELGAHSIVPVISERTVVRIQDFQAEKKGERWKRIAIESSKQCGRSAVPEICSPIRLNTFIQQKEKARKLYLSEHGGRPLSQILMSSINREEGIPRSIILLVGPEGGWTDSEEDDIMNGHYEAVSLGPLTLRSETAAIVSLAMVSQFWGNGNVS